MIVFSVLVAELAASSLNLLGSAVRLQHKAGKLSRRLIDCCSSIWPNALFDKKIVMSFHISHSAKCLRLDINIGDFCANEFIKSRSIEFRSISS